LASRWQREVYVKKNPQMFGQRAVIKDRIAMNMIEVANRPEQAGNKSRR